MNSDRNLLFGILALQMDFITRDQLVSAMGAWVLDKSKPLEVILEEQLALSGEARGVLTPLVEMHIKTHGDATQSLAVLSSGGSIKHALETIADDEVEASVGHLPRASVTDVDTTTRFEGTSDTIRYQILRPHAKGGLGEVSVALDTELNREVALKEIQDQYADHPQSRSRFVVEAEITGGLEHPGIVPVYGLGHDDDGRPYYAMRFIKGDSLKQAADDYHQNKLADPSERSLQLRKLLGRFVDVCNAIEYAHSRGVLHRDLKPGNIMLGKYGETLVVDWGLAKPVGRSDKDTYPDEQTLKPSSGSGSAPTQMGKAIGTPAYMSPEQADGRLDELGAASDVYSLGATLYYVLTGKGPVNGATTVEVLDKVRRGDLEPPREVNADIPKPMSAICMRSMAKDQKRRYESPQSLADDVERFLADEPVVSFVEPISLRTRRWMRKHPKIVASMAATLLVGLTSTLIIATVVSSKNLELADKNTELDGKNIELATTNTDLGETNEALVKANDKEKVAREEAEQQQRIAQAVRDFLHKDLLQQADVTEQADRLLAIGGTQFQTEQNPTIRELLDRAAAELTPDKIEENFLKQPLVQAEILRTVGISYTGVGNYDAAVSHLQRASELYRAECGDNHADFLSCSNSLAKAYEAAGDLSTAIKMFEELYQQHRRENGVRDYDTLAVMNNLAYAQFVAQDIENALPLMKEAVQLNRNVLGEDHSLTYVGTNNLSMALDAADRADEAIQLLEPLIKTMKNKLGELHPYTLTSLSNLAYAHQSNGDLQSAISLFKEVLHKRQDVLGENHPDTFKTMHNLGNAYKSTGKLEKAIGLLEELVTRRRKILGVDHEFTMLSEHELAGTLRTSGRVAESIELYEQLLTRRINKLGQSHADTLSTMNNLGVAYWLAKRVDKSIPIFEALLKQSLSTQGSTHPDTLRARANLGVNYRVAGRLDDAIDQLEKVYYSQDQFAFLYWVPDQLLDAYVGANRREAGTTLISTLISKSRSKLEADTPELASQLASHSLTLLRFESWTIAESYLRECLSIRGKHSAGEWLYFDTKSMLGAAVLGGSSRDHESEGHGFEEAESLLLEGYKGMTARESKIPVDGRIRITEALERLVDLYTTWDKPDEAAKWQAELDKRLVDSEKGEAKPTGETNLPKGEVNGESK